MTTATDKQTAFLKRLFTEAQQHCAATPDPATEAVVTEHQAVLVGVLRGDDVDKRSASDAISALLDAARNRASAALPVGVQRLSPQRVIVGTRYAGTCLGCSDDVSAGSGYALLFGRWRVLCDRCAAETAEQEAERKAAERAARAEAQAQAAAEARATYEAERAERQARLEAERAEARDLVAFALDTLTRAGVDGDKIPEVRLAVPSLGHNDLEFLRLRWDRRRHAVPTLFRVIGGRDDQRLSVDQARSILERIVLVVDDVPAAVARFGRELGHCGRCGRHLTDEVSRSVGLGPDCAARWAA